MEVASMFGENDSPQPSGGFSPFQWYSDNFEYYDEIMSNYMDGIRAEYKDISFWQLLICCNLVVISIAATVGYMFYTPPGSYKQRK